MAKEVAKSKKSKVSSSKASKSRVSKSPISLKVENSRKDSRFKDWVLPIGIVSVLVLALAALITVNASSVSGGVINGNVVSGNAVDSGAPQSTTWGAIFGYVSRPGAFATSLQYIFGQPISYSGATAFSGVIITIALWLILFLTFADIIATFSSFTPWVSWVVGFLIAVVAANFGIVTQIAIWAVAIFSVLGEFAIWAGLAGSFVVFIAVNLGIARLGKFVMRRKAMMAAASAESGGERLAGAVKGFGKIGKELEKLKHDFLL